MLTARMGGYRLRADRALKDKDFVFRCIDEHCEHPELELVVGRGLRIPHFRHKRKGKCSCPDGETEWHLEWKSHFDLIEIDMGVDSVTGERNRADAVVGENFVVEFQHSHITEEEQSSRERFYGGIGGMLWIVDADKKQLHQRLDRARQDYGFTSISEPPFDRKYCKVNFRDEVFPDAWINRPVGVVFDYGKDRDLIYLLPNNNRDEAVCRFYKREELISALKNSPEQFSKSAVQMRSDYSLEEQKKKEEAERRQELLLRMKAAFGQAQKIQQVYPRNKLYLHPVEGTPFYVDALRRVWRKGNDGKLVQYGTMPMPQRPLIRRRRRM